MDKNLIVEIFVPKSGTDGKKGDIATGYPVARDLILTARHVLHPQESGRDDACKIEVRWRHPNVNDKGWRPIAGIAWESEGWDLALLECPLPQEMTDWGFLSEQMPTDTMQWVSAGFPRVAGKKDAVRQPFDMSIGW